MRDPNQALFVGIGIRPEDDVAVVGLNGREASVCSLNVSCVGVVNINPLLCLEQYLTAFAGSNQVHSLVNSYCICREGYSASGCYITE